MLDLTGLTKTYGDFDFGPVDLSVGAEVLSVLGPSGSGKTTLLSTIAGIVAPDAGDISLDGRSLVGRPLEARRVGLVFQDGALFPHMTARENVAYAATSPDRVADLAATLEIDNVLDRRPSALSGGERRRVALARTLAADPDLLLLDEPLSSLDTPIRRRLRDELHDLFGSLEIPTIYVTHDQRAATVLGDRIAVLRDGTVEQVGPPQTVLDRPDTEFVARFTGSENVFDATVVEQDGDSITLGVGDQILRARADRSVGNSVTVCVRPSRVQLSGSSIDAADESALTGTVRRHLNEGDEHRVLVDVDGTDLSVVAKVQPATVEQLPVDPGSPVHVSIPPDAIHVLNE
ncbi:ABC transporter ATP-binding protein [Halobacterium wangiae]|uniref:ABC transporter ATP-binding protein n=1 Tax=Halobacterium wangiae TaxID=2902623 RepID=UPI001E440E20|nr:ABC transporter ATP-binding protein [Halobacterium wangiae]